MLHSPDSLSLIFSHLSTKFLFFSCARVCHQWQVTIEMPSVHTVAHLECGPGHTGRGERKWAFAERQPLSAAWLASRICRGGAFERITRLDLDGHCLVGDEQLANIGSLVHLRSIDLSMCCHVTDEILRRLPPRVQELTMLGDSRLVNITDAGLAAIAKLPLWSLKLDGCALHFTHAGYRALAPLGETLTSLVFAGGCGFSTTNLDPQTIHIIAEQFPRLDWLGIAGLGVREVDRWPNAGWRAWNEAFDQLRRLPCLTCLNCYESELMDLGLQCIGKIASLVELRLNKHSLEDQFITDEGLRHLAQLKCLERLDLTACNPSDMYGTSWEDASRLTDVGLGYLRPLAEEHCLESINITGNVGIFDGALEVLMADPDQLRTQTLFPQGQPVRPPRATHEDVARFWALAFRPAGPNATSLLELDVLELYEDFDWRAFDLLELDVLELYEETA